MRGVKKWWGFCGGNEKYRVTHCARTDPLPLLPSGPGGVGGVAPRRTRHCLSLTEAEGGVRGPVDCVWDSIRDRRAGRALPVK